MLSKSATMMLGLINKQPQNAYEIIKTLEFMNVKWWYNIADSTVYSTLRTLDNKGLIVGVSEKNGNMPFRTVYSITDRKDTFQCRKEVDVMRLVGILRHFHHTNQYQHYQNHNTDNQIGSNQYT